VTIGSVEKYITETAFAEGWVKPRWPRPRARPVHRHRRAPGRGLAPRISCAAWGYSITAMTGHDRVGGLLIYGIPNLPHSRSTSSRRRHDCWRQAAIAFQLDFEIGRDASLAELRQHHDAVLIASGVYKARDITCPGVGLANVVPALDYLIASNRKGLGDEVPEFDNGNLDAAGKDVVVIGGGDTAMGLCAYSGAAGRQIGALPLSARTATHARIAARGAPRRGRGCRVHLAGRARSLPRLGPGPPVRAHRMHLGIADSTGRQVPQPIEGSHFMLGADLVIKALGFDPEDVPALFGAPELAVTRWGTVKIDHRSMMTALDGVFAAGDIGARRLAGRLGRARRRDAAEQIHLYLKGKTTKIAQAEAAD